MATPAEAVVVAFSLGLVLALMKMSSIKVYRSTEAWRRRTSSSSGAFQPLIRDTSLVRTRSG